MAESAPNNPPAAVPRGVFFRIFKAKAAEDEIRLRASALAYSTLASLVPVFAIMLAVLSGPAFKDVRDKVLDKLAADLIPVTAVGDSWDLDEDSPQQETYKVSFQEHIKPLAEKQATVSVFGFIILMAIVVLLFQAAERSLNAIWRVPNVRSFFLRVAIATSVMFWGPVMLAVSVSLTQMLSSLFVVGTYFIPTVFTSLLFAAFYMVVPHTKVRLHCALAGGVLAALCWEVAKLLFLLYVTRVVSYHKVYGSLGLIPMLFLWVYVNWLLILYGAEFAYCLQHRKALLSDWLAKQQAQAQAATAAASAVVPLAVLLAAAIEVVRRFHAGGVRISGLAQALHIEPDTVRRAAERLVDCGVLARVANADGDGAADSDDPAYLPACEPQNCGISRLLRAGDEDQKHAGHGPALDRAQALLAAVSTSTSGQFGKLTLADLADEQKALQQPSREQQPGTDNSGR